MRRKEEDQMISSYNKTTDHLNTGIEEPIEKELSVKAGENSNGYWIEFPDLDLKGTIYNLFDVFYNFQKIH